MLKNLLNIEKAATNFQHCEIELILWQNFSWKLILTCIFIFHFPNNLDRPRSHGRGRRRNRLVLVQRILIPLSFNPRIRPSGLTTQRPQWTHSLHRIHLGQKPSQIFQMLQTWRWNSSTLTFDDQPLHDPLVFEVEIDDVRDAFLDVAILRFQVLEFDSALVPCFVGAFCA